MSTFNIIWSVPSRQHKASDQIQQGWKGCQQKTSTESTYPTAGAEGDTQCVLQQSTVDQADMPVSDGSWGIGHQPIGCHIGKPNS